MTQTPMPHWTWDDLETVLIAEAPHRKQRIVQFMLTRLKDDAAVLEPRVLLQEVMAVAAITFGLDQGDTPKEVRMH